NLRSSIFWLLLGGHPYFRHPGSARSSGRALPCGIWRAGVFHETLDGLVVRGMPGKHALLAASLVPRVDPRSLVGDTGNIMDHAGRPKYDWRLVVVEAASVGFSWSRCRDHATQTRRRRGSPRPQFGGIGHRVLLLGHGRLM